MTRRFKLPDGTEAEALPIVEIPTLDHRFVRHSTLGVISVAASKLTPIGPPEPGDGAILSDGLNVFVRIDDPNEVDIEGRWYCTGVERIYRWAELAVRPDVLRRMVYAERDQ